MPHCHVLRAHEAVITERWECTLHDPFWRLYRNRDAGAVLLDREREHPLHAGECVVIPAWTRYTTRCAGPVRHTYLHFDPVGLPVRWAREHCTRLVRLPRRPAWDATLDALTVRDADDWQHHLRLQALLCEALALALAAASAAAPAEPPQEAAARAHDRRLVEPAVEWIQLHLAEPLPVDLLATRCGLGRDHFTKVFTRAIGASPARHVAERRIAVAALRLLGDDAPIEDIAEATGFANRYHFTRVFQRILGSSPAAYRRQGRLG